MYILLPGYYSPKPTIYFLFSFSTFLECFAPLGNLIRFVPLFTQNGLLAIGAGWGENYRWKNKQVYAGQRDMWRGGNCIIAGIKHKTFWIKKTQWSFFSRWGIVGLHVFVRI